MHKMNCFFSGFNRDNLVQSPYYMLGEKNSDHLAKIFNPILLVQYRDSKSFESSNLGRNGTSEILSDVRINEKRDIIMSKRLYTVVFPFRFINYIDRYVNKKSDIAKTIYPYRLYIVILLASSRTVSIIKARGGQGAHCTFKGFWYILGCSASQDPQRKPRGGGTAIYGLYRYVPL